MVSYSGRRKTAREKSNWYSHDKPESLAREIRFVQQTYGQTPANPFRSEANCDKQGKNEKVRKISMQEKKTKPRKPTGGVVGEIITTKRSKM